MGPTRITCLAGKTGRCFADPWCLQRPGQVIDLLVDVFDGAHEATWPSMSTPKAMS